MNKPQTALILALVAAFDQRTVGEADVHAWHEAIGDLGYDESRSAVVEHHRHVEKRITPAHIHNRVKDARVSAVPTVSPYAYMFETEDQA